MVVICPKCNMRAWNPVKQIVRNKSGTFVYAVYRHLDIDNRRKSRARLIKRCYVRLADFDRRGTMNEAASKNPESSMKVHPIIRST